MELTSTNLKFSTADTEVNPKLEWEGFDLTINFTDYTNTQVRLKFFDVPHFKVLSSDEPEVAATSDDGVYEVVDSELIKSLIKCGEINEAEEYRHWLVGFNEIGSIIEVVFRGYDEKEL
jgi:hypothetical protein